MRVALLGVQEEKHHMKTKLLALVLLAGGSAMFAQTRFSVGVNIGGNGPGYYAPVPMQMVRPLETVRFKLGRRTSKR